jgi:tellurite resistance protein
MAILVVTVSLFFLVLFFYILKIIRFKEEVKKEFSHPIRVNFFAAFSISMLIPMFISC